MIIFPRVKTMKSKSQAGISQISPGWVAQMVNDIMASPVPSRERRRAVFPTGDASAIEHLAMSHCPLRSMNSSVGRKRFRLQHPCIRWKEKLAFWGEARDRIKARALLSYTGESNLTYRFRNPRRRQHKEKNREGL